MSGAPTLESNVVHAKILRATLPTEDGPLGQVIVLGPHTVACVVNDRWRINPYCIATFESYRWPWPFNKALRWKMTKCECEA